MKAVVRGHPMYTPLKCSLLRVSQQLLKACGRAVHESPSNTKRMGASVLTRYLVPQGVPVTLRGFEGVLEGCQQGLKLAKAVNVFRCMTRTYQIAPSRKVRPSGEGVCRGVDSSLWTHARSVLVWDPN